MILIRGISRNITGLLSPERDDLVGFVEVVMITSEPVYGMDDDGKIIKGHKIGDIRFHDTANGLRYLAERLSEYADECEEHFGIESITKDEPSIPETSAVDV